MSREESKESRVDAARMQSASACVPPGTPEIHSLALLNHLPLYHCVAAILSGALLAFAFPPLEWSPLAFLGLVPYLLCPQPRRLRWRILGAALLGYTHFLISLWWLNSVGFGAGALLAIPCALFPALWALLWGALLWRRKPREEIPMDFRQRSDAFPDAIPAHRPGADLTVFPNTRAFLRAALLGAALWTSLEWIRGWIFTGFPWNALGVSQAFSPVRLLASLAGAYGISFFLVWTNLLVAGLLARRDKRLLAALLVTLLFLGGWCALEHARKLPLEETPIRITAIQGDVPECREATPEEVQFAWDRYSSLTLQAATTEATDLFLWPEGALPIPLTTPAYSQGLRALLAQLPKPLLLGALDVREGLTSPGGNSAFGSGDYDSLEPPVFNSAFLLQKDSAVLALPRAFREDYYDKTHLVPFGEYVPFSKQLPWLVDALGMGRDLTAGKNATLFSLKRADGTTVRCGMNICFEDAFPEISREFTRKGAQLLATITNDCWYKTSSGARQHQAQAILRAVENRHPLLRSGNNSHTCLISPKGEIIDPIQTADKPFTAGYHTYTIYPTKPNAPLTPYAHTGNTLPKIASLVCILVIAWEIIQAVKEKHRMRERLRKHS